MLSLKNVGAWTILNQTKAWRRFSLDSIILGVSCYQEKKKYPLLTASGVSKLKGEAVDWNVAKVKVSEGF